MTERHKQNLLTRAERGEWDAIFQLQRAGIPIDAPAPKYSDEEYRTFDQSVPRVQEAEFVDDRLILPDWQRMK